MSEILRLDIAIKQIGFAREYTKSLIEDVADEDWYRAPAHSLPHVAWQVGHLAMAEYGLGLFRMRGRQEGDAQLLPSRFRKLFGRGTTPNSDPERQPSAEEIRDVFDGVHARVLKELSEHDDAFLDEPCEKPYALYPTKLGALYFCSMHEMLHAGQIGILRRSMGKPPIR